MNAAGIELGVGREFGNWGEGRLGYRRATGTAEVSVGAPAPELDFERGEVFLRLSDDKLDSLFFLIIKILKIQEFRRYIIKSYKKK